MNNKCAIPREDVLYLIIGLAVMVLGYLLLMGGGADSRDVFNYALFSFSRMYIAPLLIVGGFVIELAVLLCRRPINILKRKK